MRRLFVLALLLAAVACLWWFLRDRTEAGRIVRSARPTGHPGEQLREIDEEEWDATETVAREVPGVLFGTVFDPNGRAVWKAEISVLHPRPSWLRFADGQGNYELKFERAGKYLVEARLHVDLAPQRKVVEIPEEGDPARLDFHLKPAGFVYGEVVIGDKPAWDGGVDIQMVDLFGDAAWELDTDVDNGFFNFEWEPPRDVPLRLIVFTDDGFMKEPISFKYVGERIDLGQIKLTRYPTMRVRMRLPDGTWAKEVEAFRAREWIAARLGRGEEPNRVGWGSRIRVPTREGGTVRLLIQPYGAKVRVIRDVDLVVDQLYELELNVRSGPLPVRRRLLDESGAPVRARFRVGDSETDVEVGPGGWFSTQVPHGGVFDAYITGLLVAGAGWVPLRRHPDAMFLLDADDPRATCSLPIDRRVLVIADGGHAVTVRGPDMVWKCAPEDTDRGLRGHLMQPVSAGRYTWLRGKPRSVTLPGGGRYLDWDFPNQAPGTPVTVGKRGWTIIDTR